MPPSGSPESAHIELICFDLGGVLVRVHFSWTAAFEASGVPVPEALVDTTVRAEISDLVKQAMVGEIDAGTLLEQTARLTRLTFEESSRVSTAWLVGPYAGVDDLIKRLSATPVHTACLSNTHDHHWQLMTGSGAIGHRWLGRLSHRFASHLIGHVKPDPAIYRHVERVTGTSPERILFFDDTAENCQTARDLGWHAHWIDASRDPISQMYELLRSYGVLDTNATPQVCESRVKVD